MRDFCTTGCVSCRKKRPIASFEASCGACAPRLRRKPGLVKKKSHAVAACGIALSEVCRREKIEASFPSLRSGLYRQRIRGAQRAGGGTSQSSKCHQVVGMHARTSGGHQCIVSGCSMEQPYFCDFNPAAPLLRKKIVTPGGPGDEIPKSQSLTLLLSNGGD